MRVAIVGAGGIAYSYAAFLSSREHQPVIWSPSNSRARELQAGAPLSAIGALEGSFNNIAVADSPEALVADAPVVIYAVPAYAYQAVMDQTLAHLRSGQTLIISAHLSFAALYLSKKLAERGLDCPIAVWNTTASTGRQTSPSEVSISLLRGKVEMAVIPQEAAEPAVALCTQLFGERFALKDDMIGVDLGNLNPAVHYGIALFNITRMEKAETWAQQEYMTPAVCRLLEDLDTERLALAAAFCVTSRTIHQSYAIPGKVEVAPLEQMLAEVVKHRKGVNGPKSLDTRYVTEDVPYGLLTTLRLGEMMGIDLPLHRAGILMFSSLYRRDFTNENRILPEISAAFANAETLRLVTAKGWTALLNSAES